MTVEPAKVDKESVDYSKGMGRTRCRDCKHFMAPTHCERVKGIIDPLYWCKLFRKRKGR